MRQALGVRPRQFLFYQSRTQSDEVMVRDQLVSSVVCDRAPLKCLSHSVARVVLKLRWAKCTGLDWQRGASEQQHSICTQEVMARIRRAPAERLILSHHGCCPTMAWSTRHLCQAVPRATVNVSWNASRADAANAKRQVRIRLRGTVPTADSRRCWTYFWPIRRARDRVHLEDGVCTCGWRQLGRPCCSQRSTCVCVP